VMGF